jgi:hypothetical protein
MGTVIADRLARQRALEAAANASTSTAGAITSSGTSPIAPATSGGLPLDGRFEAGRRVLDDTLNATLGNVGYQRGLIAPQMNLQLTRLGTDQGLANRRLSESMADRGILNSGVTTQNRIELSTGFDRTRQDWAQSAAEQYSLLAQQEQEARLAYARGLQDLILQIAAAQAGSPYLT